MLVLPMQRMLKEERKKGITRVRLANVQPVYQCPMMFGKDQA